MGVQFSDRYFYNSKFVNKQLLDKQYTRKLMSVYKVAKPSLLYSDVVRNNKETCTQPVTKMQVVHNHSSVVLKNDQAKINRGRIVDQGGKPIQSGMVASVNTKTHNKQCAPHMWGSVSTSIDKTIHVNNVQENQFVHMNKFQPLSEPDIDKADNCHSCEVNTIVSNTEGKHACSTTVAHGNDVKTVTKGKNLHVSVNNARSLARGHDTSSKRFDHTVSSRVVTPNTVTTRTSTPIVQRVVGACNGTNSLQNHDMDKYALEIQNSSKSQRIQEAKAAVGNKQCMEQNRPLFGFIPIYGLKSRVYDNGNCSACTDIIELHKKLRTDGRPNYLGLQIPIMSKLNYGKWAAYLHNYWDWQLPLLIKYGFPLDFDRNQDICSDKINHKSAIEYPRHVATYLREEIGNKAMLGPFTDPPIENLHTSPFMTRDKSSSTNRRVIIDLSWPLGHSVNSGVGSDSYLGTDFVLTYPSVDNITEEVLKLGKGCQIFKVDISRAFRHVPIDPGDLDLLGLY